jgi:hypothetical protein
MPSYHDFGRVQWNEAIGSWKASVARWPDGLQNLPIGRDEKPGSCRIAGIEQEIFMSHYRDDTSDPTETDAFPDAAGAGWTDASAWYLQQCWGGRQGRGGR